MSTAKSQNLLILPAGLVLGQYRIIRRLGQGGFGITYLAEECATGKQVVIKENLPTFCACRHSADLSVTAADPDDELQEYPKLLKRFVEEAQLLARLHHPNIVKVLEAFEALGTAYYVMPWVGGKELHKAAPAPADITEAWLLPILRSLLEALEYLHLQNIYHRDVKPANILLMQDGTPVIIDFGTARAIISERSATMVGSPGYSPVEQVTVRGKRGPWTDLYSLGATCYRLLTGQAPPESVYRLQADEDPLQALANRPELRGRFSPGFLAGIDKALSLRAGGRWQTAAEWLATLPEPQSVPEPSVRVVNTSSIRVTPDAPSPPRRNVALVLLVLVLALLVPGGYILYDHAQKNAEQRLLTRLENERQAREEAERKAREEAERKAREEAERKAREEAERKAREEAERKAREEAERKAREEAERKAREEAERQAREEAERKAREEAERQAREEAELARLAKENNQKGDDYYFGRNGCSVNYKKAAEYFRKAAEQGNASAQNNLGFCYANGQGVGQDDEEAVKWIRKAAEQGDASAQNSLGVCYERGLGVGKDDEEAVKWYRKAAEQGYADAQYNLGVCYYTGQGVGKDYEEAVKWYRKAAEKGDASAQYNLGLCYYTGQGVGKDYEEAVKWYRKAADQGHAKAQYNLGVCYERGQGVGKDYEEAVKWYRKAAEQGHASAQYNLGVCYDTGQGVGKDYEEAVKWYRKAAEQGIAYAQYNLGLCYKNGQGVRKDYEEAVKWYRKAAEQGDADAQYNLGLCYKNGQGVRKDYEEAVKWYRKAAEQGDADAQKQLRSMGESW